MEKKNDAVNNLKIEDEVDAKNEITRENTHIQENNGSQSEEKIIPLAMCNENYALKLPLITLWLSQRDKRKLPYECHLLHSLGRLPRQMTRGPFLFGKGISLERIDEDPLEEAYNEGDGMDEICNYSDSIVIPEAAMQSEDSSCYPQASKMKSIPKATVLMQPIPEGTRMEEHNVPFSLNKSQRNIIHSDKKYLEGICEIDRLQEMMEEELDDENPMQSRIWT